MVARGQSTYMIGPGNNEEHIADIHVLQRGICNPHLIDGKKYILRAYYLTLGDGRTYIYNDCLGTVHAVPFDASKGDRLVHVSSWTKSKVPYGQADTRRFFTLSDIPEYERIFRHMVEHSKRHSLIWAEVVAASKHHPEPRDRLNATRYHVRPPCIPLRVSRLTVSLASTPLSAPFQLSFAPCVSM